MPKRKVLIVEDEFFLYEELCDFFEKKGFAIVKNAEEVAVDNYEEAVKLVKEHRPDIAILDIGLKGEKDGVDIGIYIRQHHNLPVVYLSGQANDEYIERLRENGDDKFVCKGKPLNKEQLWHTFRLALPKPIPTPAPTVGDFIKVKEVEIVLNGDPEKVIVKKVGEPIGAEIRVRWDDFIAILSLNKKILPNQNNNVLLCKDFSKNVYAYSISLDKLETQLPYYFARFSKAAIVNLKQATERSREQKKLFYKVPGRKFEVSDNYKIQVQEKVNRLLRDTGYNIPEK